MRRLSHRGAAAHPVSLAALGGIGVLLLLAIIGPFVVPYDPLLSNVAHALEPPSPAHWFGTDQLGRDLFSRVVAATRLDLAIAASAVAVAFVIGNLIGAACGFFGGRIDQWIGRLTDVLMAFPLFVVAMALVAVLGNHVVNIIYATALINLPFYIRFSRTEVAVRKHAGYVRAARLGGAGEAAVLFGVLLPNILPNLMVQMSLNFGWAILNAAGLSFIGIGIQPPTPEWGILVSEGAPFILTGQWWVAAGPSLALMAAVFAFNLAGDGLRDLLDVRSRA